MVSYQGNELIIQYVLLSRHALRSGFFSVALFITHLSCIWSYLSPHYSWKEILLVIFARNYSFDLWNRFTLVFLCILLVRRAHIRSFVNNNAFINKIVYAPSVWILRNCDELNHIPLISICIRNVRFSFWFKSQFAPNACSLSCKKWTNNLKRWDKLWLVNWLWIQLWDENVIYFNKTRNYSVSRQIFRLRLKIASFFLQFLSKNRLCFSKGFLKFRNIIIESLSIYFIPKCPMQSQWVKVQASENLSYYPKLNAV